MPDRDFETKDGKWFPIMNELAEKLMTFRLSGNESQIFWMLLRKCYGFQKSCCELRWKEIKENTQLNDGSISKAIAKLKEKNIIHTFQKASKTHVTYKINSKLSSWKTLSKKQVFPKSKQTLSKKQVLPIKDNIKEKDIVLQKEKIPFAEIISVLNIQSGKNFRDSTKETRRAIRARWNEGFRLEDFRRVIVTKCKKWKSDEKMVDYLRPQTLFGTKFEAYLNESPTVQPKSTKTSIQELEEQWMNKPKR